MHGVAAVSFEGCAIVELHNAPEFVSLGARGDVLANPGLEQAGYLALELADGDNHVLLLVGCDTGLPAECEGMNDHGDILTGGTPLLLRFHLIESKRVKYIGRVYLIDNTGVTRNLRENKDLALITRLAPRKKAQAAAAGFGGLYFYFIESLEIVGQMNQFSICSRAVTSRISNSEPEDSIT